MKIYDPTISAMVATEFQNFVERSVDDYRSKAIKSGELQVGFSMGAFPMGTSTVIPESNSILDADDGYSMSNNILVPTHIKEETPQADEHNLCSAGSFAEFSGLVEAYSDGKRVSQILTDQSFEMVTDMDPDLVLSYASDAFLIASTDDTEIATDALTLTGQAQNMARETAWGDIAQLSNVYSVYTKRFCEGAQRGANELSQHIRSQVRYYSELNSDAVKEGATLEVDRDFTPH